jgi:hypothetical protein
MNIGVISRWHNNTIENDLLHAGLQRVFAPHTVVPIEAGFELHEDSLRRLNALDFLLLSGSEILQDKLTEPFDTFGLWFDQLTTPLGAVGLSAARLQRQYRLPLLILIEQSHFFLVRDSESLTVLDHPKVQLAPDLAAPIGQQQALASILASIEQVARKTDLPVKVSLVVVGLSSVQDSTKTIAACAAQTHENVEILITQPPAREVVLTDSRMQVIAVQTDQSLGECLNAALACASGEYVSWIEAGNTYVPDAIQCMAEKLEQMPEADVVYAGHYTTDTAGAVLPRYPVHTARSLLRRNLIGPCFLFRRCLVEQVGPYSTTSPDPAYEYWLRARRQARFVPLRAPLLHQQTVDRPPTTKQHLERLVRRQLRTTLAWHQRVLWRIADSELFERFGIPALRLARHALHQIRRRLQPRRLAQEGLLAISSVVKSTDVSRWKRVARKKSSWDNRNHLIAQLIPDNSTVLDLGSGAQTLRGYLRPNCEYQPCDVVMSSDDVLLCDFNAGIYPAVNKYYDYVICSGVLEYIRQPQSFLAAIATLGHEIILSYAPYHENDSKLQRAAEGWVNHLSEAQLREMFAAAGLVGELVGMWYQQLIFQLHQERGARSFMLRSYLFVGMAASLGLSAKLTGGIA